MVHWMLLPAALAFGTVLTLWLTANRMDIALERRYRDGVERGRYLEQVGLDDDPVRDASQAVAAIRRVGRVRVLLHAFRFEDQRRERVVELVRQGVGL